MPRKIVATTTLDDVQEELFYTRAALKADLDANDFLALTDEWQGWLDGTRQVLREAAERGADADAARAVSNMRLDSACTRFGDRLFLACDKQRESQRFRQFFKEAVSVFVRRALGRQVAMVKAWLEVKDPVLDEHRAALTQWSTAVDAALSQSDAVAMARGKAWVAREALAADLTSARDGLYDALRARARERGLGREWASVFFRTESSRATLGSDGETLSEAQA